MALKDKKKTLEYRKFNNTGNADENKKISL
jgi:hypothetical protein